jgi:hypothetical protein
MIVPAIVKVRLHVGELNAVSGEDDVTHPALPLPPIPHAHLLKGINHHSPAGK